MLQRIVPEIKKIDQRILTFFNQFKFRNYYIRKSFSVVLFVLGLHWFYSYIGIYDYIDRRPCSIHSWAQCERASVAQNYYKTSMDFFKPRVQKYTEKGGVTGLEFPIIYYTAAILYKLFGFNEAYLRIISLLIVSLGFFFFYLLANRFLKNNFLSLAITASAALSPVLLYYTPNFLPDAPSLGLAFIAWYFFFKHKDSGLRKHLNLFVFFGTLGGLLKVISVMSFIIVICLVLLDKMKFFKNKERLYAFDHHGAILSRIFIGMFLVASWYMYANWLSKAYENQSFALGPVMGNGEAFKKLLEAVENVTLYMYYSYESYVLMVGAFIFIFISIKFVDRILLTITLLYIFGNMCYLYLFLPQFIYHDYYTISMLPAVFFLFLTFADAVSRLSQKYFASLTFIFFIILFFNMKECIIKCERFYRDRYDKEKYYGIDERPYYDIEKRLRAIGIKRTDVTLSGFDDTYCNTPYLMDQLGFVMAGYSDSASIAKQLANAKIQYLVLNDSARFNKIYPNHFEKNIVLTHRGLIVYKLR